VSEIKRPVTKLVEGKMYIAGADDWLITEQHTIADIVRYLIDVAGGTEEIEYLLDEAKKGEL